MAMQSAAALHCVFDDAKSEVHDEVLATSMDLIPTAQLQSPITDW
jgi:hypothetical protein